MSFVLVLVLTINWGLLLDMFLLVRLFGIFMFVKICSLVVLFSVMLLESLLFIGFIIMLCVLMYFLHVVSAICGIPPVICLETSEHELTR